MFFPSCRSAWDEPGITLGGCKHRSIHPTAQQVPMDPLARVTLIPHCSLAMRGGEFLNRFKGQFPHLYSKNPNGPHPTGTPGGLDEKTRGKCFVWCLAQSKGSRSGSFMKLFLDSASLRAGSGIPEIKAHSCFPGEGGPSPGNN